MDIIKTVFGYNLEVKLEDVIFNFEFRENDDQCSSDLCSHEYWLLCVITCNGTPVLGKEYWGNE